MSDPNNNNNRLDFIREVLRSAPAGQFNAMLEDIQTLAGAPLEQELLEEIQLQHERQTCANATVSTATATASNPLTASLHEQMEAYQTDRHDAAQVARREIMEDNNNTLLLRTHAERIDEAKCRTGYWTAEWTIQCNSESPTTNAQLSGQVSMCTFSFEDGNNVQARSTKEFELTTVTATASDDEASSSSTPSSLLATAILQQIATWEDQVLASLHESYATIGQSLKSIRGILPITHTRLNWNVVTQQTIRNLQETVSK